MNSPFCAETNQTEAFGQSVLPTNGPEPFSAPIIVADHQIRRMFGPGRFGFRIDDNQFGARALAISGNPAWPATPPRDDPMGQEQVALLRPVPWRGASSSSSGINLPETRMVAVLPLGSSQTVQVGGACRSHRTAV